MNNTPISDISEGADNSTSLLDKLRIIADKVGSTADESANVEDKTTDTGTDKDDVKDANVASTTSSDSVETSNSDEEELGIDSEGNILKADGTILYTKDQVKVSADGTIEVIEKPVAQEGSLELSALEQAFGVKFTEPIEVKTSDDYVKVASSIVEQVVPKRIMAILGENPDVAQYYAHRMKGGTPESFFRAMIQEASTALPDDSDVSDAAVAARKNVVAENYLRAFGYYEADEATKAAIRARVDRTVNLLIDGGVLAEEAKIAYTQMTQADVAEKARLAAEAKQTLEQQQASIKAEWDAILKTVTVDKKIGDLKLSDDASRDFAAYLTKTVKDGKTQEMLDVETESRDVNLMLAYIRFATKNGSVSIREIAKAFAETANVRKIGRSQIKLPGSNVGNISSGQVKLKLQGNAGSDLGIR